MPASDFAILGLGVMGRSLALNAARKGLRVSVCSPFSEELRAFARDPRTTGLPIRFVSFRQLAQERRVWLMLKAGPPTDALLRRLLLRLRRGSSLLEGGNSHWRDTERRQTLCAARGLRLLGCGVSGGEQGALEGPSLMAGGSAAAWRDWRPILLKIAARGERGPCAALMGPGGCGHFVKTVHNGIEYALMQAIAEVYDVLRHMGLTAPKIADLFERWNRGELGSFLLETAIKVLRRRDDEGKGFLVDKIRDRAGQKGTGQWTAQEALELGVPAPQIIEAVQMRSLSTLRSAGSGRLPRRHADPDLLAHWLLAAQAIVYAQGLHLLHAGSRARGWGLDLRQVLDVWSGGCIIRSRLLGRLRRSCKTGHPMLDLSFRGFLKRGLEAGRRLLPGLAPLPLPVLAGSLYYAWAWYAPRLPMNLIQACRDAFGAHGYERLDQKGSFHTSW